MTRLQRKHRKDIWFYRFSNLRQEQNENLKKIWFITDEELTYLDNNLSQEKWAMFFKPQHLSFSGKRKIVKEVNQQLYEFCNNKARLPDLLTQAEEIQRVIFNFGNNLINIESQEKLEYYEIKVLKLIDPITIYINRKNDKKTIAQYAFYFDNYLHPGNFIQALASEYKWQKAFKGAENVFSELFHIAYVFGVEKEYNQLISESNELEAYYFNDGADLYMEGLSITFKTIIDDLYEGKARNEEDLVFMKECFEKLNQSGWVINSPIWNTITSVFNTFSQKSIGLENKDSSADLIKDIITQLKRITNYGHGFYAFSNYSKEYRYAPSKKMLIKLEEILRDRVNYWKYE